ncbi:methyltransferase [Lutimaribacter sp. EGI FJ00015]|uniref:Methyltransferase n=1 Tax=Lutimaribacter degradans TaxID=2945989 RepID=A0ACC5ZUV0_9RHOB|nr:methyltransferase [Lutimaribacter sp. EGI FJ00013]MCM2561546.1 methyltransferase [Lutimaribacter sp. EGI FJ00013]MCO0612743.1 methyltransferase [Lutimaribacter sp. EGI FJ00015]MCO0635401.1 methyltransferase [Lutimaribacter sp. EGI FJ00014]
MNDLTRDGFLGGRLQLWQPRRGYRAGVDPVILAATVPETARSVLDMGCGVGAAGLCVAARLGSAQVTGLEVQAAYAALAQRNALENGLAFDVVQGDLTDMPRAVRDRQFDHVIANPPYFLRDRTTPARDEGRETAMGEGATLAAWVRAGARRVRDRGEVTMIQRADRLPELLALFTRFLGSVRVLPLMPRPGRDSQLVLIRGRKGGRAAFRLHAGVQIHLSDRHESDRPDYAPLIRAVLHDAAALPFP